MISVTPLYAAVLALLFVGLSCRVIGYRRSTRVSLGDGGDGALLRRQRVHGNFAEYVPFALVLMLLAELQGSGAASLHAIGLALLAGRVLHAIAISREPQIMPFRVAGMVLTFAAVISGAVASLAGAIG